MTICSRNNRGRTADHHVAKTDHVHETHGDAWCVFDGACAHIHGDLHTRHAGTDAGFATDQSAVKLSLSLYFAGFALAQLLAGPASDAFGRRKASIVFLLIFLGGGLVAISAPTIEVLLFARLVQGIGASVGMTVARAVVRDQFTGAEASSIMNLIGIMLAVGPALGPTIGGLSLAAFGWKSVFF